MAKNFSGGINSLIGQDKPTAKPKKTLKSTSEEGTKEGETRATFIVKVELLDKIKAISRIEGFTIKDVTEEALSRFISTYEKKNGKIDLEALSKRKSVL
jgi:NRPS condensation-like uncharacterized protein